MEEKVFITEAHHLLGGDNSLDLLASDLTDFVRWEMNHTSRKELKYDSKKYTLYYKWGYDEIRKWFDEQGRVFHYPVFLIDEQSKIAVKVSVGRDVRSRRKIHDTAVLLATKGNERGSHLSEKIPKEGVPQETVDAREPTWAERHGHRTDKQDRDPRLHTIYINTYYLSWTKGVDVRSFIRSEDFALELAGTVKHEFMHAFDTYFIKGFERMQINRMKKIYKKYKSDNSIGKDTVTMSVFGKWEGKSFNIDKRYILSENHLRDFFYMLPYYFAKTEMNAYLQTFSNQLSRSPSIDEHDCDIYRRYLAIKRILQCDVGNEATSRLVDGRFVKDFTMMFPKLKKCFGSKDPYGGMTAWFLELLDKYLHKMHKILYDFRQLRK